MSRARALIVVGAALLWMGAGPRTARAEIEATPPVGARSGFTEGAGPLEAGERVLEIGSSLTTADAARRYAVGEMVVAFALAHRLDVKLGLGSFVRETSPLAPLSGFEDPKVALKLALVEEDAAPGLRGRPAVDVVVATALPLGSGDMATNTWSPEIVLVIGRAVTPRLTLTANAGVVHHLAAPRAGTDALAAAWLGCSISRRLGAYVEAFGEVPLDHMDEAYALAHGGVTILLARDTHLDLHAGHGVTGPAPALVAGAGVAQRW